MATVKQPLPEVVSSEQWKAALDQLLVKEKELTRARDALNAERRKLPMVKVAKHYTLQGENGAVSLLDLFEGRRQLIVYHFMFAPDWNAGCDGCSWLVDAMTHPAHLHARDTSLVMVSRAPREKLVQYRSRMGWTAPVPWYSSYESDFNVDFGATTDNGERHGASVFIRDGDDIYRTYYTGARGVEYLGTLWTYLDLTPFGRQETWEDSPEGWPQTEPYVWNRRHDEYDV
ncbi:conserved hypothetical protein [Marinobacter salarius]|jgi:predicted dithiol-disulfide oxidoreductase (DUF899 family)|uniref:DUF899 domain-containing protein n=1 Tax=Marinobacter salarius TaxID=1420917 RepID=UPI00125B8AA1|nr:DUF899 domain-containing protein [Marinobacter salarius]VVT30455.1 conserved hypothetical protein [Marinobacter salarius]VXB05039.1 conserved hypothetical protein [Marinobacter salarius]|tara:strand:- start:403 stop:1092 length:690 start_codon:yes stop_codon:yes gene_type:complete